LSLVEMPLQGPKTVTFFCDKCHNLTPDCDIFKAHRGSKKGI
jgi:hypothetical protein